MFRTVPLSIFRSFSTVYKAIVYFIQVTVTACEQDQDRVPSWTCSQAVSKPVWHIPMLCVQWKTPDDGQRNCPKHVGSYSKNKFEKLVNLGLVGFIIGMTPSLYMWLLDTTWWPLQNNNIIVLNTQRRNKKTDVCRDAFIQFNFFSGRQLRQVVWTT